jgi:ABC-type transport system involved in multi-copper enzyme maturation permease subunit
VNSPEANKAVKINRWLPYWAVFQADMRQTAASWVYRAWVLVSLLTAVGYLLYRVGVDREAGIVQHASNLISDLLRWCVFGSVTLIIVLTAGSISGERGTMADSVLSRGISRYQYYLGKWHSRLVVLLGTFLVMGLMALGGSFLLLHADLNLGGSLIALGTVAALLGIVISAGVMVSSIFNSTLLAIAVLWLLLYGTGFLLSLLPAHYPSPHQALSYLPSILRGEYNAYLLGRLIGWSACLSCFLALFGMGYFSRRDV